MKLGESMMKNKEELKKYIAQIVSKSKYALVPDVVFKKSKCESLEQFVEIVKELKDEGRLIFTKKGRIASSESSGLYTAKIISMSKGFAFAKLIDKELDVLIYNENLKGAIVGDGVLLYNLKTTEKGTSGSVQRILERESRTLTGYIKRSHKGCELVPDGPYHLEIPINKAVTLGARNGDKVQVSLSPATKRSKLSARVIKVYGKANSAKICSDAIIDSYNIPSVFPKDVSLEAMEISKRGISKEEMKDRLDLRQELIFTIDGKDAKDLDDAISVEKTSSGWNLGVHIADVSHYVKENSRLDEEAMLRGTSVYFADRVIPMLPKEISNGICSLNAHEDKLTFSCLMELNKVGDILSYKFKKTVINSKVRGVYSEINSILDGTASLEIREKYKVVERPIKEAYELSKILIKKAEDRGNLDFSTTEARFELDENGVCVGVEKRVSGEAERLIEQFMITANQAAAMYAKKSLIPFVYRVHDEPNPEKLKDLSNLISALGFNNIDIVPGMQSLDFAKVLDKAKDTEYYTIISHQLLRSMAKARYSENPRGHFGLSLKDYCHFTSPIRRYPDLSIHRILSALVGGMPKKKIQDKYTNFAVESSKSSSICEVRAMNAERDAEKCYMAEYMVGHIGEVYDGVVSGGTPRGMFVELANGVEGFIELGLFKNADYVFEWPINFIDKKGNNKISIGDKITIRVIGASVENARIDFEPFDSAEVELEA